MSQYAVYWNKRIEYVCIVEASDEDDAIECALDLPIPSIQIDIHDEEIMYDDNYKPYAELVNNETIS